MDRRFRCPNHSIYSFAIENKSWKIKTSLLYIFFHLICYGHITKWLCNLGNHTQMLGFAVAYLDQILVGLNLAGNVGASPAHQECRGDWLIAPVNLTEPAPDIFSHSEWGRTFSAHVMKGIFYVEGKKVIRSKGIKVGDRLIYLRGEANRWYIFSLPFNGIVVDLFHTMKSFRSFASSPLYEHFFCRS